MNTKTLSNPRGAGRKAMSEEIIQETALAYCRANTIKEAAVVLGISTAAMRERLRKIFPYYNVHSKTELMLFFKKYL